MMYTARDAKTGEWREENLPPFDELMIAWNGNRPTQGNFLFSVSVLLDKWSPWLFYAKWGSHGQTSGHTTAAEAPVRVYQDTLEVLEGRKATGFQIKIEGQIHALHVYTNSDKIPEPRQTIAYAAPIFLPVKGLSQMILKHARPKDLCSPTATTAVIRYLSQNPRLDPVYFASQSLDSHFDIFGNWVLNTAQAAAELGPNWDCWVERLSGFDDIYQRLHQGAPTVVSIRGPLPGSAEAYPRGHLIAVIGYAPEEKKVICMDPAFTENEKTIVRYDLADFLEAWSRRGRAAYVFSNNATVST